jgi:hypothetical protein
MSKSEIKDAFESQVSCRDEVLLTGQVNTGSVGRVMKRKRLGELPACHQMQGTEGSVRSLGTPPSVDC